MSALRYCKQVFLMALPGVRVVLVSVIWEVGLWKSLRKRWRGATSFLASCLPPSATTLFLPRSTRTHSISSGDIWATFCYCLHMRTLMVFIKKSFTFIEQLSLQMPFAFTSLWTYPTSSIVKSEARFSSCGWDFLIGYIFHFSLLLFSFLCSMTLIYLTMRKNKEAAGVIM